MKKFILGFFTALIIATAAFAVSPDGEIWKYTLKLNENYSVNYAYRDGETFLFNGMYYGGARAVTHGR